MAERPLEGKVVMMTGAGRGLGRAMALGMVGAGASVALIDLDEDVLGRVLAEAEKAGGQGVAIPVRADVTAKDNAQAALAKTLDRYGRVDVLVNDAALGPQAFGDDFMTNPPKFWECDLDMWQRLLSVNAYGTHLMASTVVPHMLERGSGRIINVTTSLGTMYLKGSGAYGPSKAASEANTCVMSQDLEGTGVTANVLVPGGPANTRMIPEASGFERDNLIQPTVMVAPSIWLASDASADINGMRFLAALWDTEASGEANVEKAGATVAWQQLGTQAIYPEGSERR